MSQRKAILASALLAAVALGIGAIIGPRRLRRTIPLDVLPASVFRVLHKHVSNQQLEAIGAELRAKMAAGEQLTVPTIEATVRRHVTAEQFEAARAELESTGLAQQVRTLTPAEQLRMLSIQVNQRWPGFGDALVRYFDPSSPDAVPENKRGETLHNLVAAFIPEQDRPAVLATLARMLGTTAAVQGVYL